ncbi:MAG: hypothetical protein WAM60_24880 [Candidatus Promineifilaceae bacterium]
MIFRNRKSPATFWLVLIAVLALGLSACGGDDSGEVADTTDSGSSVDSGGASDESSGGSSSSGALPDTCNLLSSADVDSILGGSGDPIGSDTEDGQVSTCSWLEPNNTASLIITVYSRGEAGDEWADLFITSQAGAIQTNEEVSGLGLKAIINEDNGDYSMYWNKENAYVVNLTVVGDTTATKDGVISLGQKIDSGF